MVRENRFAKIRRILLVRPDALGDVMMIIPSINALRRRYPDAHISVLLRTYTAELLADHPAVNEVIIDDYTEGRVKTKRDFFNYVSELKKKKFDAVIYYYNKFSYALAGAMAGIPIRIGDGTKFFYRWLYTDAHFPRRNDFTRHVVEQNLDYARVLDVDTDKPVMTFYPSEENKLRANKILESNGISTQDFVVGIHLGTGGSNKPWHPQGYAGVINELSKRLKLKFVITGGHNEEQAVKILEKSVAHTFVNLVGKTSLGELIAVMQRYNLYMSVDTGPMHIAAALNIPTLLISPTKHGEPTRWGPWLPRQLVLRKLVDCPLDCSRPQNCSDERCLNQTSVAEVVDAAIELINGGGNSQHSEIMMDWCKKSFKILVFGEENSTLTKEVLQELKVQGLNAVKEDISKCRFNLKGMREIVDMIVAYDINIVHFTEMNVPFWFKIVSLWAGTKLSLPPMIVKEKDEAKYEVDRINWLDYYVQKFQERGKNAG